MTSSGNGSPYSRRILWLGLFVVILVAGYTAAWFYAADRLEQEARRVIGELNRDDVTAECTNAAAGGFPFRIGIFCDGVAFADRGQGANLVAGAFRSAAQVYNPFRIVGELDGPAHVEAPGLGVVELDWELLHASTRIARPLPERSSVEARKISASREGAALFAADNMQAHTRPNGADLDVALSFDALTLDKALVDGRTLPPLSGTADVTIADGIALLASDAKSLRGHSATIRSMTLSSGPNAGFTLAGTLSVDQDGLVNGNMKLTIRNPQALAKVAAAAFPEAHDHITAGFGAVAMMGSSPTMPLKIVKGRATLGFIPLGNIPPL